MLVAKRFQAFRRDTARVTAGLRGAATDPGDCESSRCAGPCKGRRGYSGPSLLKRGQERTSGYAPNNRISKPSEDTRDVPAQGDRFHFDVHSTVSLFEPGETVQAPHVTGADARR